MQEVVEHVAYILAPTGAIRGSNLPLLAVNEVHHPFSTAGGLPSPPARLLLASRVIHKVIRAAWAR